MDVTKLTEERKKILIRTAATGIYDSDNATNVVKLNFQWTELGGIGA